MEDGKEGSNSIKARKDGVQQEYKVFYINMIKAPMNSQRLMLHAEGLHREVSGPLHVLYAFYFCLVFFMGYLSKRLSWSLILLPS